MKGWALVLLLALACHSSSVSGTPDADLVPDAELVFDSSTPDASEDGSVGPDADVDPLFAPLPPVSGGSMAAFLDRVIVADPDRDAIFVFRVPPSDTAVLERTISLEPGDEPGRVVVDSERALVVLRGAGELATIDLDEGTIQRRDLCANPRGVAVSADGIIYAACAGGTLVTIEGDRATMAFLEPDLRDVVVEGDRLYVSRLRSAEVLVVDRSSLGIVDRLVASNAEGQPNSAWRMRAAPEGGVRLLHQVSSQDPIEVAEGYGEMGECAPTGVVQSVYSHLRVGEAPSTQLLPFAIVAIDFASGPTGIAIANAGASEHARSAGVLRYAAAPGDCVLPDFGGDADRPTHSVEYVAGNLVAWMPDSATLRLEDGSDVESGAAALQNTGRALFHAGTIAFVACASCHPEGGDDGVTWNFVPTGLRRTQSLLGGLLDTAPFHWDGDNADMSAIMQGSFTERMGGGRLMSDQVDAVAQWLEMLPAIRRDVSTDAETRGAGVAAFESAGCASCHAGYSLTNNENVDVGTDGAFQVPSLRGVSMRAPYLHDGRAATLEDAVTQHSDLAALDAGERSALLAYLESL